MIKILKFNLLLVASTIIAFIMLLLVGQNYTYAVLQQVPVDKVRICHSNEGIKSYTNNIVSIDSIFRNHGHDSHEEDIIPPFIYSIEVCIGRGQNKICEDKIESYEGKNWNQDGQEIWADGCQIGGEGDPYLYCEGTSIRYGEWTTEYVVNPEDPTEECIQRTNLFYDIEDSEYYCGEEIEYSCRPISEEPKYCIETITVEGEWTTEYVVNPEDPTEECIQRTNLFYDAEDKEYDCGEEVEYSCRPIEIIEEDPGTGDILGEKTEREEVVTQVLGAKTGAGDNVLIYAAQIFLSVLTVVSSVILIKPYIK